MAGFIISCLSQKGGVGKSTIARLIARTFAAAGRDVVIADFDEFQSTCARWSQIRKSQGHKPPILAMPYSKLSGLREQEVDLVVFDGAPVSCSASLDIALRSDLVVVPTGLSHDDLEPQLRFAEGLVTGGIPKGRIIFVLSRTAGGKVEIAAARDLLKDFRIAKGVLSHEDCYQKAQNEGRALSEVDERTEAEPRKNAERLAKELECIMKAEISHENIKLTSMSFNVPSDWHRSFKREALERGITLHQLFIECFEAYKEKHGQMDKLVDVASVCRSMRG